MNQQIYDRYKQDAEFRRQMLATATRLGGGAYRFEVDGGYMIIRHNPDGTFTWIF